MSKRLLRWGVACGVMVWVTMAWAAPTLTQADLDGQKELFQVKLDALKDAHQKDAEALRARLDSIDKRIDDQNTHAGQGVDRLGVFASLLGSLITVLLAGLGLLGFVTVNRRTKEEAQEAAKAWFEDKSDQLETRLSQLQEQLAALERHADSAKQEISGTVQDVKSHAGQVAENILEIEQATKRWQQNLMQSSGYGSESEVAPGDSEILRQQDEVLQAKPEDKYSFADWDTRAFSALSAKNLEEAAYFWLKAAKADTAAPEQAVQAWFYRGVVQGQLGQNEAEIATYAEMVMRYGDAPEAALREPVARALVNKVIAQGKLGQNEAAIATCEEVLKRYGDAPEAALREPVAQALVLKGLLQGQLGQGEAAIETHEEVVKRYADAPEAALRELVARALLKKGIAQGMLGQKKAEIATYEEVVKRYAGAPEAALREQVAHALSNKCVVQGQLGESGAAIATCEELVRRYANAPEVALRVKVAQALIIKGSLQGRLGQGEAAIETYAEVVKRYAEASEAGLRESVARAHNGLGFAKICEAKKLWEENVDVSRKILGTAYDDLKKAVAVLGQSGLVFGNLSYVACLQGDLKAAEDLFLKALRAPDYGGEEVYRAALGYLKINPIPEDETMRALVERLWQAYKKNP